MKKYLLTLVFLAFASLGFAQLVVTPPESLATGDYAQLKIKGATDAILKKAVIDIWPEQSTTLIPAMTWGGEPLLLFAAKNPGAYRLLIAYPGVDGSVAVAKTIINVGGIGPTPPLPPNPPNPPNPPTPDPPVITTGKIWIGLVYESGDGDVNIAKLLASKAIRDYCTAGGHSYAPLDPHEFATKIAWVPASIGNPGLLGGACPGGVCPGGACPPTTSAQLQPVTVPGSKIDARTKEVMDKAVAAGLPRLVIINKVGGKTVFDDKPPMTEAAFLTLLKKYGG